MAWSLSQPIAAYYCAATPAEVAAAFTEDASVVDERRVRRGRAEILAWREDVEKIAFTQEILAVRQSEEKTIVTCRVAGAFPGSPIELDHTFTLSDGLIQRLEIV